MKPSALKDSVLLVIDAQLEYLDGSLPLSGIDSAVREIAKLLALARRHGTPVFHIVHHARPGAHVFDPNSRHVGIIPSLEPQPGEPVIVKSLPNAFARTDLNQRITAIGRKELIVAGFMTHMCVSATSRSALDLGYRTTVVSTATATRDLPNPGGGSLEAKVVQEVALAALADRFAVVVPDAAALLA